MIGKEGKEILLIRRLVLLIFLLVTPYIVLVSAHPALIRILKPVARLAGALQPVTVGITKSAQSVWACIQCWQNVAYEPCKVSCCLDLFSATSFSSQFTRNTGTPVTFHQAVIYAPAHTTNWYIWYLHPMASYGCHLWGISKLSSGPLRKTWMTWLLPMLEAGPGWAWLPAPVHFLNRLRIRPRHPIGCEGYTSAQNYRSKANLWPIGACPWCDLQEISNWPKKYLSNLSIFT